jgi:hypothetical protein
MEAKHEDIAVPIQEFSFAQPDDRPSFHKIDVSKVQNLDDVKKILAALELACTYDIVQKHGLEFLIEDQPISEVPEP